MRAKMVNWFALASGIIIFLVIFLSFYVPWWQLTIGDNLFKINASPLNTNFGLLGTEFTFPLIFVLNIISLLTLCMSGVLMLVYSILPGKSYSKQLLCFAYKKPLYSVVAFIVGLFVIVLTLGFLKIDIPLAGSSTVILPTRYTMGVGISVSLSAGFLLPFWLAVTAAGVSIVARVYHTRIVRSQEPTGLHPV